MAYEIFSAPLRKNAIPTGSLAVKIGSYSITLNEQAFNLFYDRKLVLAVWDKVSNRAGLKIVTNDQAIQGFKLITSPKTRQCRVVGVRPFLIATGLKDSAWNKVLPAVWDEAYGVLSWDIPAVVPQDRPGAGENI